MILVRVTWQDAHAAATGWCTVDDIEPDPRLIESVGHLVAGAKHRHLVLAQSVDGDHLDHVLAIPLGMVRRVERLDPGMLVPLEPAP